MIALLTLSQSETDAGISMHDLLLPVAREVLKTQIQEMYMAHILLEK